MRKITKVGIAAGLTAAALAMYPAQAHADTASEVAHDVCADLYANPTTDTFNGIVADLLIRYDEETENKAMYVAMHEVCPEFMPLAIASLREAAKKYTDPRQAEDPQPKDVPFNGKRMI
jgi:hypothetical protein